MMHALSQENRMPTIDLAPLRCVAQGKKRDVYLIPAPRNLARQPDELCVLKVPRYAEHLNRHSKAKRVLLSLSSNTEHRAITREVDYFWTLEKGTSARGMLPIPPFFGFVETSQGLGALWEAVIDDNQSLAPTLKTLAERGMVGHALPFLNQFTKEMFETNLITPDLHAGNLVLGTASGQERLFLIDGFSDHHLISLRDFSRWYNTRSLLQRCEKIARQTGLRFDPDQRLFAL